MSASPSPACRLCGGATRFALNAMIMGKHNIAYYLCDDCRSLQTEAPYWLEEAYAPRGIGFDGGMATRTIQIVIDTLALLYQLKMDGKKLYIDFGGGTGLFTRLMRDHGFNFFHYDKYEQPYFSNPYNLNDLASFRPHVITAYEVLEHLPNPAEVLDDFFRRTPELILFGTDIFHVPVDPSWPYLALPSGQHVFFYSETGLNKIAGRYGYVFRNLGFVKLFAHPQWILECTAQGVDFEALCALVRHNRPAFDHYAFNLFAQSHAVLTDQMRSRVHEHPKEVSAL